MQKTNSVDRRYRRRGWLLLALCPLVAAIAYLVLAIKAPPSASWPTTLSDSKATWEALRLNEKRYFRLDYDTAIVSEVTEFERQSVQKNKNGELIFIRDQMNENGSRSNVVLEVLDPRTRTVTRSIELPNRPKIIGGSFAVTASKGTLYCTDLDARELELKSLSVHNSVEWVVDAQQARLFWTIVTQQNPTVNSVEVYKIADDASLALIHSFPVFDWAVTVDSGVIKYLTADRAFFEIRDLSTSKLISSTSVSSEYVSNTSSIALKSGYLAIRTGTEYRLFDPVRNIELEHRLPTDLFAFDTNEEAGRMAAAFYAGPLKRARIEVFDLASGKVNFTMQTSLAVEKSLELKIVNRETLIVRHAQNGLTIDFLEILSGRLARRIAPYGWVAWALPLLLVTLAIWATAWLRASAYANGAAWVDVCLLTALALAPLVVRLMYIHMPSDVSRLPIHFSQGIVGGLANVCALWMAIGRTRFTLRILPFLGTMALVIRLLDLIFSPTWYEPWGGMISNVSNGLFSTAGPAIGLYFVYCSLRWFGWSAYNVNHESSERPMARPGVPMRDYFLLTAVLAILVTVSLGLSPVLPQLFQLQIYILNLDFLFCVASFTGIVASFAVIALLALSNSHMAARASQVIALVLFLVVIGYPIGEFIFGLSRELMLTQPQIVLRVIASGVLSTFVYLQAYRLRGWRLGRTRALLR